MVRAVEGAHRVEHEVARLVELRRVGWRGAAGRGRRLLRCCGRRARGPEALDVALGLQHRERLVQARIGHQRTHFVDRSPAVEQDQQPPRAHAETGVAGFDFGLPFAGLGEIHGHRSPPCRIARSRPADGRVPIVERRSGIHAGRQRPALCRQYSEPGPSIRHCTPTHWREAIPAPPDRLPRSRRRPRRRALSARPPAAPTATPRRSRSSPRRSAARGDGRGGR